MNKNTYIKIALFVALAVLGAGRAHASDVTYSADTTVSLTGFGHSVTFMSGSTAESVTVGTDTITVTTGSSDSFTIQSANAYTLNNDGSLPITCTAGYSQIVIAASSTVVVTPNISACSNGGPVTGGGGGGGYSAPVVQQTTTPVQDTSVSTQTTVQNSTVGSSSESSYTAPVAAYSFTKTLRLNSTGSEVKLLQQFLNAKGFTVAKSGAGSPGKETMKFGPATKSAFIKYQKANKLGADGVLGPKSREYIKNHQ